MKNAKWLGLLAAALYLGAGSAMADTDALNQDASTKMKDTRTSSSTETSSAAGSGNEVVGTITSVDGMTYTISDFRGKRHELELADDNVQWGGPTQIGSRVKARVEGNQITELVNLEE